MVVRCWDANAANNSVTARRDGTIYNTMKPEQQRIAIAEACGWRIASTKKYAWVAINPQNMECAWSSQAGVINEREASSYLPDYLNDLNAMHEAEKAFIGDASSAMTYAMYLLRINGQSISTEHDDLNCDHAWIAAHAKAAQRAEAFLRTIDKWEETP